MKKAASIFLRADIQPDDISLLIRWMENPSVTRYLNEAPDIGCSLRQLLQTVPAPMLQFHFNQAGRFFLVCRAEGDAIGFVKLRRRTGLPDAYEIVYAIGEQPLWGQGYGTDALRSALSMVFLQWRGKEVVARIYPENRRSLRSVCACGFRPAPSEGRLLHYRITSEAYLNRKLGISAGAADYKNNPS